MEFIQVDVFAEGPYEGNPLAVFPDAAELSREQMQAIAREMNLSETSFVSSVSSDAYDVRIFTPEEELPFAGHPTLGTAWVLRSLGKLSADNVIQRSGAGETPVELGDDVVWFRRTGSASPDLESRITDAHHLLADALSVEVTDIGLEAREIGRSGRLQPAFSDAGLSHLMVPLRDVATLGKVRVDAGRLDAVSKIGVYCFTAEASGRFRARGLFPALGVPEDPATGSACACLGVYLSDRLGAIDVEVHQGIEMGRPSRLLLRAGGGDVSVGGRCKQVLTGVLSSLP